MNEPLPAAVRAAFALEGEAVPLPGGEGHSVRVGDVVVKPGAGEDARWHAELLAALPQRGFRVPSPVRAVDGRWVVEGWTAYAVVAGATGPEGRWAELFAAARAFHGALVGVPAPEFLADVDHQWARADRGAWGEVEVPVPAPLRPAYDALAGGRRPLVGEPPAQLVHGDLAGNVLFADGLAPAVIDFSPYWRPVGYAEAVVAVDGMLWYAATPDDVLPLLAPEDRRQLLIRATLFRLLAFAAVAGSVEPAAAAAETRAFERVTATVLAS